MEGKRNLICIWACAFVLITGYMTIELNTDRKYSFSRIVPRQVHISKSDKMTKLTWSTLGYPDNCSVSVLDENYVQHNYSQFLYESYFFHLSIPNRAIQNATSYTISCAQGEEMMSRTFLVNLKEQKNKALFFGDFSTSKIGDKSNKDHTTILKPNILKYLAYEKNEIDSFWHLGDIAYDLFSNSGYRGFEFLYDIEKIASFRPYIAVAGNHEIRNNFKDYKSFFNEDLYFSKTVGSCKVIAINTEFDFYLMKPNVFPYKHSILTFLKQKQLKWLKNELKSIDRSVHPFVVVVGHKPLYCSKNERSAMIMKVCTLQAQVMRNTFEEIFETYKVDLGIFAHIHLYERTLPVRYERTVGQYDDTKFFVNPNATIYVLTGVAGNLESEDIIFDITDTPDPWTVVIKENLGYSVMISHNLTHLEVQHFGFGKTQWDDPFTNYYSSKKIEDNFWIIKQ